MTALRAARPNSEYPLIGFAVVELARGRPEEAVRLLQSQALPAFPDSSDVKSFIGLALHLSGRRQESRDLLHQVQADRGATAEATALAGAVIGLT